MDLDETLVHYQDNNDGGKVYFRPFLEEFLNEMSCYYEIVIFTASIKEYADIIINYIDPGKKLIKRRYYRRDTVTLDNNSIKDLSILKCDLKKTIIVDNIPENFIKQKENGIFIKSWYTDKEDICLRDLIPILKSIVTNRVEDVRIFLKKYRDNLISNIKRGCLFYK